MKFLTPLLLASACLAMSQNTHEASIEDLAKRIAEPDFSPASNAALESRADIEARAGCVPGTYKKKKGCTANCKGRGRCSRATSPGSGFLWACTCPTARRDTTLFENPAGAEDLGKRIAEPVSEPLEDFSPAEDAVLEDRDEVEADA